MIEEFEEYLNTYVSSLKNCEIKDAISYSIDGGKRIRPLFIFSILKGMNIDYRKGFDAALALEFIQTYSLIHDDLPEMDNDDFRRGKPSLHKKFDAGVALLTGDEMLTDSFGIISSSKDYSDSCKVKLINIFSSYSGLNGMLYGQFLDIITSADELDLNKLTLIHDNKTSGLFKIACISPAIIAGYDNLDYFERLGYLIGLIFQSQDDLFDLISNEAELGKSTSDKDNNKATALTLFTIDELKNHIKSLFTELDNHLKEAPFNTDELNKLIQKLKDRNK